MAGSEEQEAGGSVKGASGLRVPYALLPGFMGGDFARQLVDAGCADPALHSRAEVTSPKEKRALDPGSRRSWDIENPPKLLETFEAAIALRLGELCTQVGLTAPDNPFIESGLSAYRDGDYFRPHVDLFTEAKRAYATYDRMLTAVYYAHRDSAGFTGGELVLHPPFGAGESAIVAPANDLLVIFPSFVPHEVCEVRVPGDALDDARFSINCWVGRRRT